MNRTHWLDLITRAVEGKDEALLGSLADQLARCETACGILRAKGYGVHGQTIDAVVRLVPGARDWA